MWRPQLLAARTNEGRYRRDKACCVPTKTHLSRTPACAAVAWHWLSVPGRDGSTPHDGAGANPRPHRNPRGFSISPPARIMNNPPWGKDGSTLDLHGQGAASTLGHTVAPLDPLKKSSRHSETSRTSPREVPSHTLIRRPGSPACVRTRGQERTWPSRSTSHRHKLGRPPGCPPRKLPRTPSRCRMRRGGCYYASTTAYSAPNSPLPDGVQPSQGVHPTDGRGRHRRRARGPVTQDVSILDMVSDRAKALSTTSARRRRSLSD